MSDLLKNHVKNYQKPETNRPGPAAECGNFPVWQRTGQLQLEVHAQSAVLVSVLQHGTGRGAEIRQAGTICEIITAHSFYGGDINHVVIQNTRDRKLILY